MLNVIDEFTHECLAIRVARKLKATDVIDDDHGPRRMRAGSHGDCPADVAQAPRAVQPVLLRRGSSPDEKVAHRQAARATQLPGEERRLVVAARSQALGRLDGVTLLLTDPGQFLYSYVRKEAVLSSQIEGTQSSLSDLLLFENEAAPGVPLDDVEAVCRTDEVEDGPDHLAAVPVLDVLSSLVDKSMVLKEDVNDVACYRLHETMREYAVLKARQASEQDLIELRCATYYRDVCQQSMAHSRPDSTTAFTD